MSLIWSSACANTALAIAALNSRALARAGMLDGLELSTLHHVLRSLEEVAANEDQLIMCKSIREWLPPDPGAVDFSE